MDDREQIAWLYRRVGFGVPPGQLDALAAKGPTGVLDELVDPDRHGVAPATDPWAGVDLSTFDPKDTTGASRELIGRSILAWVDAMGRTPRPLEEWMRWFWHGHFVSTIRVVKSPQLMVGQLRTFGEHGLGDFRSLLRAVTVDPAMLIYLDGVTNRRDSVNENYGREVLELFALGIGNYTEADVRAGAVALTGWRVARRDATDPQAVLDKRAHDDTPQSYLGRSNVHDVDTVVDAIVAHPACAPFVTAKLARAVLGPDVDQGRIDAWAQDFAASGLQIRPLVRSILQAGMAGEGSPLVMAPVPWLASMLKASGAPLSTVAEKAAKSGLAASGQIPWDAPNVAGWPGGRSWLSSSTTIARFNIAGAVATGTAKDAPIRVAAARGDSGEIARALSKPAGFSDATVAALRTIHASDPGGERFLALAMSSPDVVVA